MCMVSLLAVAATAQEVSKKEIASIAEARAKELKSEGWNTSATSLPLKNQLVSAFTMQFEMVDGDNKYIFADGQVTGATFEAARIHAMEIAKRNLISLVDNMTVAETEGSVVNVEGDNGVQSESFSETKHKNSSNLKLGNIKTVLTYFRKTANGKVEVVVQVACLKADALKAAAAQAAQAPAQNTATQVHTL